MNSTQRLSLAIAVAILCVQHVRAAPDITGRSTVQPSPSPDGAQIAFISDYVGGHDHLFVSNIDGSQIRQLTFSVPVGNGESKESDPAWSPTGTEILFTSTRSGRRDVWGIHPDGGALRQLTQNAGNNDQPAWAPGESLIAFVSGRAGSNDLWLMNVDGTNVRRLTTLPGQENHPSFSPTGTEIVFSETIGGVSTLQIVAVAGGTPRALTTGTTRDWYPSWSTAGIAFSSNRAGDFTLWVVRPDGSGLGQVSTLPAWDPAWSGGRLLFTREADGSNIFALTPTTGAVQQVTTIDGGQVTVSLTPSPNRAIAVNGNDVVNIAVASTPTFNAVARVDPTSLTLGHTGYEKSLVSCNAALTCGFAANKTGLKNTDTEAIWRGRDVDGFKLEGRMHVKVSGGN